METFTCKQVTFDAGTNPEPTPKRGHFRKWQALAFGRLDGRLWRTLTAPTGSGKSFLIMALASADLTRDPKAKVVIAVPQVIIGESFKSKTIHTGKRTYRFAVDHVLLDGKGTVARLVDFLLSAPGSTPASRTIVCTHATLVAVQKRVLELKQKRNPWEDVSLYIDEMHHSDASEDDAEAVADRKVGNQLGRLVSYWVEHKLGHLLLATATPLRADPREPLVPPSRADDFVPFEYEWADYIASMQHLRKIIFRFIIGEPEAALRTLFVEGQEKTIVYLPHVSSPTTQDRGGKAETLQSFMDAIGPAKGSDAWTTTLRCKAGSGKAKSLRCVDMVTVAGRAERRDLFLEAIEQKQCPDVMFALNIGKEGFDWPPVARSFVVGERASMVDVLQMIGRLLRDVEGKSEIEFTMVLPGGGAADDVEQVCGYLKKILATLLIADFLRPSVGPKLPLDVFGPAINGLIDGLIAGGDLPSDVPLGGQETKSSRGAAGKGRKTKAGKGGKGAGGPDGETTVPPIWISAPPPGEGDAPPPSGPRSTTGKPKAPAGGGHKPNVDPRSLLSRRTLAIPEAHGLAWNPEYIVYVREMMRVVAFKKSGKTLTQIRDESGKRAAWPVEDVVRLFSQGKGQEEYDAQRRSIGGPNSTAFPHVYGKTYQEVRDGRRIGDWPCEGIVRAFSQGLSEDTYNSRRNAIGGPCVASLRLVYGKTFCEIRDGQRGWGGEWPSEGAVRVFAAGKTCEQYNEQRGAIGGPRHNKFSQVYGKTFREVRDGRRKGGDWPTEDELRPLLCGKSVIDYAAQRHDIGGPNAGEFLRVYGKTFAEVRDGQPQKVAA